MNIANKYCINKRINSKSNNGGNCVELLPKVSFTTNFALQDSGLNGLLTAAMPLLLLMIKLKNIVAPPNAEAINTQAIKEVRIFEANAQHIGYASRTILAASYCLCTAFDEAVLATPWGDQGAWVQHTLLSKIHRETWGGEHFYIILNKMAEEPANNLDILELFYTLISLGFEGKYFNQGKEAREELRHALFNLIKNYRRLSHEVLSPCHPDKRVMAYKAQKRVSLRHVGAIMAGLFVCLLAILNYLGYMHVAPLLGELRKVNY